MNRDGIAALFDALIFLAIASLVSVALLSAFNGGERGPDGNEQSMVEAAHLVLLRSTFTNEEGNAHPVEEQFKLGSLEKGMGHDEVEGTLDLLLPGREWRWTVQIENNTIGYGAATVPGPGTQLYCSLVRAPFNGEEIVFRLEVWNI